MPPAGRHPARSGYTRMEASSGRRLAATYRPRWSSRLWRRLALAVAPWSGVVGSCDHALTLTSRRGHDQSRVPSLVRLSPASREGVAFPSVLRTPRTPARHDPLSPSAYTDRLRLTWPPGRASPVPHQTPVRMPSSLPRGRPAPLRSGPGAVCCLRREMSGSAGPTFRVFLSRGCKVRVMLGLRTCSPPARSDDARRALDAPLRRGNLVPRPGPATRRSALTAAGLAPASSMRHEPPRNGEAARSGRTIGGEFTAPHGGAARDRACRCGRGRRLSVPAGRAAAPPRDRLRRFASRRYTAAEP